MEPGGKNPKNFHISTISVDYDFKNVIGVRITKDIVLVKIEVDNMEPTLLPGDVVICQKSQVMTFVPNESASVIVSKKGCFARRIHKHHLRNYFLLSNDNPAYKIQEEIEKNEVLQLLLIYGKVFPGMVFKSLKQRMDSINESLKFLKTETSKMRKVLDQRN